MAPFFPRMHLFEIDDQPWFPNFLRKIVQDALTETWMIQFPPLQQTTPAKIASSVLIAQLGDRSLASHTYIDFCAGGGGPTPSLERSVNAHLAKRGAKPVRFVLSDLHPNVGAWARATAATPNLGYVEQPVDASSADRTLIERHAGGRDVFRLFNLAFHHFDDGLARAILKDTVEGSNGFAIFELQDRSVSAFITCLIFGIGILLFAPYWAWKWRSPQTLLFTYLVPIAPFVLVFDGFMSSIRSRTPDEVEALLRSCGADASDWELRSGQVRHLWPTGYVHWMVCAKKGTLEE